MRGLKRLLLKLAKVENYGCQLCKVCINKESSVVLKVPEIGLFDRTWLPIDNVSRMFSDVSIVSPCTLVEYNSSWDKEGRGAGSNLCAILFCACREEQTRRG